MCVPQVEARLSTTEAICDWIWSRSLSSSSRVMLPMTSRSEAWAYCDDREPVILHGDDRPLGVTGPGRR